MSQNISLAEALQLAVSHHQSGRLPEAEKLYRAILEAQPNHPDANHNLGVLAVGVGQPAAALPFLKAALEVNPTHAQYWLSLIDALIRSGQQESARQVINTARQRGLTGEPIDQLESRLAGASQPTAEALPAAHTTAIALRETGCYREAAAGLQDWLKQQPQDAGAHALLAHVLLLDNQTEAAATAIDQARRLDPSAPVVQRNYARLLLKRQQADAALQSAQAAQQADPNNPESWLLLAAALGANKRDAEALPLVERALQACPDYAEAFANRAVLKLRAKDNSGALADAERALMLKPHLTQLWALTASLRYQAKNLPGAIEALQKALELEPGNVSYMVDLGEFLRQNYQVDAAISLLDKVVAISPDHAGAWTNLGTALHGAGHLEKARVAYETALRLKPDQAEVAHNLGAMAKDAESWEAALKFFDQALAISPDHIQYLASKGSALLELRRPPEEVERIAQKILAIQPGSAVGFKLLGALCQKLGRLAEAAEFFRKVVAITPDSAEANAALGGILKDVDELAESESYLQRALELNPADLKTLGNLLFIRSYLAHHSPSYRLAEAQRFGVIASRKVTGRGRHADVVSPPLLRVGLVSGDLRAHVVSYFLESFLPHVDSARVEFVAYPTQPKSDEVTDRLHPCFSVWRPIYGKSDAVAAQQIVDDGIHILIDLSGHTAHNRLPLFAWKPAPVQVSWLGYFATTGLEQMDFLLGDPYVTPPDEEAHFIERVWRMPESYLCFSPPAAALEVAPLPALITGAITFGCFNNLAKMNDAVVALWARVLCAVPSSRLLLKTKQLADEKQRQRTAERFAAHGIPAERLVLEGPAPRDELLATYHRVDIALDPFPYPGGTTSAEALWMGVPVLTKRGDCFLSHVGESIAHNAGMADWIARDAEDYVAKAVEYSTNLEHLAMLRAGMRQRLMSAPLFDAKRFARHFEDALWGMWQEKNNDRGSV